MLPGISGGTMALILGIWPQIISALSRFELRNLLPFIQEEWRLFLPLLLGASLSILTFSRILHTLLQEEATRQSLYTLFLGLILGSSLFLFQRLPHRKASQLLFIFAGFGTGLLLQLLPASHGMSFTSGPQLALWFFFSGALATMAMLLPGISGSYLLLLIGSYTPLLKALKEVSYLAPTASDLLLLLSFGLGILAGALLFSKSLKKLIDHAPGPLFSTLIGFMLGGAVRIWPYLSASGSLRLPSAGELLPFVLFLTLGTLTLLLINSASSKIPPSVK